MQPGTQQPNGEQQGFYRPSTTSPYDATAVNNDAPQPEQPAYDTSEVAQWEASEYIHRSKDAGWVIGFSIIVIAIIAASVYFQAWTFTALTVAMAIALGVFAFRTPKTKQYVLTHQSLKIDEHEYRLADFKAFGVLAEDAFFSIMLIPVKRFMPAVTMYFAHEDGEKIVGILSTHLPLQEIEPDPIDALMRRLHF